MARAGSVVGRVSSGWTDASQACLGPSGSIRSGWRSALDERAAGFPSDGGTDDRFAASEGAEDVSADLEFADAAGAA
jgi:hypothetical protein